MLIIHKMLIFCTFFLRKLHEALPLFLLGSNHDEDAEEGGGDDAGDGRSAGETPRIRLFSLRTGAFGGPGARIRRSPAFPGRVKRLRGRRRGTVLRPHTDSANTRQYREKHCRRAYAHKYFYAYFHLVILHVCRIEKG